MKHYNITPSADMLAHLKRERIHDASRFIVGGAFADAHKNPRIAECGDGILRRWLLPLVLHSADYKEK